MVAMVYFILFQLGWSKHLSRICSDWLFAAERGKQLRKRSVKGQFETKLSKDIGTKQIR